MKNKIGDKIFRTFIYALPAVLYFSYYPIISLGGNETMNFELSLPLIWLVLFDAFAGVILIKKKLLSKIFEKWKWLLFPVFVTLSVIWSNNVTRAMLTVGIMWLIYFAVFAFSQLRKEMLNEKFKKIFWRWFFGSALFVCGWCWLQCIMDVVGVSRDCTLLCSGCTHLMFGFPHPNGFAIEPQFMGNLLLAPAIVAGWMILRSRLSLSYGIILSFVLTSTLFLTFSRGAIYAFAVAMIFMSVFLVAKLQKKERRLGFKKIGIMWGTVILAFVFTLNTQGLFAQVSHTNDTYANGVTKVLNQLSLGVIDIKVNDNKVAPSDEMVEESVVVSEKNEAVFDGYVAESTDTRVRLTNAALTIWRKDVKNAIIGVGVGGAGQALYDNDLSPAPKEIVQNEYASLLLEVGVIGFLLFVFTIVLAARVVIKNKNAGAILTLMVAYGVTLFFFSGLPNALHIYLLPAILMAIL